MLMNGIGMVKDLNGLKLFLMKVYWKKMNYIPARLITLQVMIFSEMENFL